MSQFNMSMESDDNDVPRLFNSPMLPALYHNLSLQQLIMVRGMYATWTSGTRYEHLCKRLHETQFLLMLQRNLTNQVNLLKSLAAYLRLQDEDQQYSFCEFQHIATKDRGHLLVVKPEGKMEKRIALGPGTQCRVNLKRLNPHTARLRNQFTLVADSVETIRPYLQTMKKGLACNLTEPFDLASLIEKASEERDICEESIDAENPNDAAQN